MKKIIETNNAPAAIGPYNQGVVVNNICYTSGQIPVDPKTGLVSDDICEQAKQSLNNCKAILEASGSSVDNVFKTLVFITDINDFAKVNEVYADFFKGCDFPARSCVEVSRLPKDVKIEIEMIGIVK